MHVCMYIRTCVCVCACVCMRDSTQYLITLSNRTINDTVFKYGPCIFQLTIFSTLRKVTEEREGKYSIFSKFFRTKISRFLEHSMKNFLLNNI